jgi:hypothetical protein
MNPLAPLIQSEHPAVLTLIGAVGTAGSVAGNKFDNRPTWDNKTGGGGFDNRPTWDNKVAPWDNKRKK